MNLLQMQIYTGIESIYPFSREGNVMYGACEIKETILVNRPRGSGTDWIK